MTKEQVRECTARTLTKLKSVLSNDEYSNHEKITWEVFDEMYRIFKPVYDFIPTNMVSDYLSQK